MTMSDKVIYNFTDRIWQVGSGAKWSNIPVAKEVDLRASACTPKKGVAPKDIYLDLGTDIGKGNKVVNASFCISIPIDRHLAKPKVEFYDGSVHGKNAPNKIKPFMTISKPTKVGTKSGEEYRNYGGFEGGTKWYKNYYNCKGITKAQLKNLIVVLKFGKASASNAKMTIGWTKIEVKYDEDTSWKLDIYSKDSANKNINVEVGKTYTHTITFINDSDNNAYANYIIGKPAGCTVTKIKDGGTKQTNPLDSSTLNYSKLIKAHSKSNVYVTYKLNNHTSYNFTDVLIKTNDKLTSKPKSISWKASTYKPKVEDPLTLNEDVIITPPFLYVNTDNQFIDVIFKGKYNRDGAICYKWNRTKDNCNVEGNPLLAMVEGSEFVEKTNISSYSINVDNQTICIDPDGTGDFMLHLRIKVNPIDTNDYLNADLEGYYYEGQFYKHSLYDELVRGYYDDNKFYDEQHQLISNPTEDIYYYDLDSGFGYYYENGYFEQVVLAESIVYYDIIAPSDKKIYLDVLNGKRFKYYDDTITVCHTTPTNFSRTVDVDIFGEKTYMYSINDSAPIAFDSYYPMTISTGLEGVGTIKCKSKRSCFFQEVLTDYTVIVESPQAFIGCVPLTRAHQADNTANTTNGLISNSYLNRRYKGKTGEMKEDIGMELLLAPSEVATLQGLAEMDKPIPLDLVPYIKDGDPLNHRGWAELYAVKNIKKLNSFTYSCEPEVDYLTHDLNTAFEIIKRGKTNDFKVPYYLAMTQDFTDKLSDLMVTDNPLYSDMIDDYGYVGYYELENNDQIVFTSNKPVSKLSDWDIKWRNIVNTFTTEDLDDNFNVKIQLIKLNDNADPTVYFEYLYDGFKHYNHTGSYAMNMFENVYVKWLEKGVMKEQIYSKLSLLPDDLTSLANNNKIGTKMWANSETVITPESGDYFDIILATGNNNLIMGETVTVTITNDFGYYDRKKYLSDMYGRIRIPTKLEDTEYTITAEFEETKTYRPCTLKIVVDIVKEHESIIINYLDDYDTVKSNDTLRIKVTNNRGVPLVDKNILVDIRDTNSNHYGACINYITDSDGMIYPIVKTDGGSKIVRARYANNDLYSDNFLEQHIYVSDDYTQTISIESDDIEYEIDQINKQYSVRLMNGETPLANETINFILYNNEEFVEREAITNGNGFATIPIYLTNGVWYIDSYYAGKEIVNDNGTTTVYNPTKNTNTIKTLTNSKKDTYIGVSNYIYKEIDSEPFIVTLFDDDYVALESKPIHLTASANNTILFDGIVITDENGQASLPLYDTNANVTVDIAFDGDIHYNKSNRSESIAFKYNLDTWSDTRIIKDDDKYYLQYYYNDEWTGLNGKAILLTINKLSNNELINSVLDNYTIHELTIGDGRIPLPNLNGDFNINITYIGDDVQEYKACNIFDTVTKEETVSSVPSVSVPTDYNILDGNIINFNGDEFAGKVFKAKFIVKDNDEVISNAYVSAESSCFSDGYTDENGEIELEILNTTVNPQLDVDITVNVGMLYDEYTTTISFLNTPNTSNINTVTTIQYLNEDIEGHESFNYQEIKINTNSSIDVDANQIADYYTIRLTNLNSKESFELDNMSVDKFNSNYLQFYLDKGNWNMNIYTHTVNGFNDNVVSKTLDIEEGGEQSIIDLILINGESVESSVVDNFDDQKMFGGLVRLKFRENKMSIYEYGFTSDDNTTNVKHSKENIALENNEYYLRFIVEYHNRYHVKLSNLEGLLQFKLTENLSSSDIVNTYSNMIVSPVPLPDDKCLFTRLTDDGRLYYYSYDKVKNNRYIGSPYNVYKGGTNLKTELGTEIFNFETGANPIYITNGLCKMSIHRLTGYIELFVWESASREWYLVNVLKVKSDYTIRREIYSDDCISVTFSGVTFTMWRGRPYIEIQHNGKDIQILNYKDRVYCEIEDNGKNMRLLEEQSVGRAIFDVNTSTQRFDKALQVGQNIALDNFDLYDVSD